MDCSPPGSSVHGILQAGILEWVAIPFSGRSSSPRDGTQVCCTAGRFFTVWATRITYNGKRIWKRCICVQTSQVVQWWWIYLPVKKDAGNVGSNPWVGISSISKNTGKFHGQRSLSCYSPWGQKKLDSADSAWLYMYSYTYICSWITCCTPETNTTL